MKLNSQLLLHAPVCECVCVCQSPLTERDLILPRSLYCGCGCLCRTRASASVPRSCPLSSSPSASQSAFCIAATSSAHAWPKMNLAPTNFVSDAHHSPCVVPLLPSRAGCSIRRASTAARVRERSADSGRKGGRSMALEKSIAAPDGSVSDFSSSLHVPRSLYRSGSGDQQEAGGSGESPLASRQRRLAGCGRCARQWLIGLRLSSAWRVGIFVRLFSAVLLRWAA